MIQRILHSRHFLASTRVALYFRTRFAEDNIFLRVMAIRCASAFLFFNYSYTLFLYTTPYIAYSILLFGIYIFASRQAVGFGHGDSLFIRIQEKSRTFSPCGRGT